MLPKEGGMRLLNTIQPGEKTKKNENVPHHTITNHKVAWISHQIVIWSPAKYMNIKQCVNQLTFLFCLIAGENVSCNDKANLVTVPVLVPLVFQCKVCDQYI